MPEGVNQNLWLYEHVCQFVTELNLLIVKLHGICTAETCPKMKATDVWLYKCACHNQPQDCSAIDYMIHQLDHAETILKDPKNFKDRFEISDSSVKCLNSIARRVYRLFSHTYHHHESVFVEFEKETHLCKRFTQFCRTYKMMSNDMFIIPEEAII